jgi:methionyl-tRNA formyltransferase
MGKRILFIGTDTTHRRYIVNRLLDAKLPIAACLFETERVAPPFPVGPAYESAEEQHLLETLFQSTRHNLDRIDVFFEATANSADAQELMKKLSPDLALVSGAGRISPEAMSLVPDGLLNLHLGIATAYRGLESKIWAAYHGDWENIGVTLHRIDENLDTGDVVEASRLDIPLGTQIHQLRFFETVCAADLAVKWLKRYVGGDLCSSSQEAVGRYYSFMPKDLRLLVMKRFNKHFCRQ